MKFIRWLFSNIILIVFVLALTYAYVYWDNLTGEDTPAGKLVAYLSTEYDEVREFLDDYDLTGDRTEIVESTPSVDVRDTATVPQVATPPRQPMPDQSRPTARSAYPAVQQPGMRQPMGRPYPDQAMMRQPQPMPDQSWPPARSDYPAVQQPGMRQPMGRSYPDQAMMRQPQPMPDQSRPPARSDYPAVQQPGIQQPMGRPFPDQAMMRQPQPMPQTQPMPDMRETMGVTGGAEPMPLSGEEAVTASEPVSSTRELWISAREEYHRGNIDVSIRNYKEVIASAPDNFDAYGELGNVYLSRGNRKEAANAYFEAAAILVKMGQVGRARSLLPMLGRLDRARAEELNQLIQGTTG